jgi:photosystem II stability/assembly factor-like uncharacterized protein
MPGSVGVVFVGVSGETLSNRVEPPDTYGTGLYRCDDLERGDWVRVGGGLPDDPEVRAIAASGARLLVGTQYGVHASDDGGATWRLLGAPRPGYAVWSIAIHPADPDVLLAGYEPGAILRSEDAGATWRPAGYDVAYAPGTEGEPRRVIGLAFDPAAPDHAYGAIEVGGLVVSRDGGRTWTGAALPDRDAADCHAVAVGAAGVLAATRVGLLGSADRGASWREVLGEHLTVRGVSEAELLAVVEGVSARRFAGNVFAGELGRDADGALRFGLWARRPGRIDYGDAFDPAAVGARRDAEGRYRAGACVHALVGVVEALLEAHPGARVTTPLAALEGELPARLRGAVGGGACDCNRPESRTGPAVLEEVGAWFPVQPYLRSISVAGGGRDVCVGAGCGFMSRTGALYRSRDGGRSWRPLALPATVESGIFGVARRPDAPETIVCAARDGQICWSTDDGASWSVRRTPEGADPIYALAVT